eukprot:4454688-Prymnesium_polylepis.1
MDVQYGARASDLEVAKLSSLVRHDVRGFPDSERFVLDPSALHPTDHNPTPHPAPTNPSAPPPHTVPWHALPVMPRS